MHEHHEYFVLFCTAISGRLIALVLCFLFHIPVWFVLTALPALQLLANVSASSLGFEPHESWPHLQGSSSKPLLLVLSLTCKIHKFHLDAKEGIKQRRISTNSICNAVKCQGLFRLQRYFSKVALSTASFLSASWQHYFRLRSNNLRVPMSQGYHWLGLNQLSDIR